MEYVCFVFGFEVRGVFRRVFFGNISGINHRSLIR
ncbi:MAG: hypothetical protein FD143_2903 [Ignavibacteria bacterium]|nr:MAG: hypothetical protein FD143_2903 [Ignavibacteria bacterium]